MKPKGKNSFPSMGVENKITPLTPKGKPWKTVFALGHDKDEKLFSQHLDQLGIEFDQETIDGSNGEVLPESFDIAILDETRITEKFSRQLKEVKKSQEPLFTPVLTLISEKMKDRMLDQFGEVANEFLTKPLKKDELSTRIVNLLNLRYLSEELEIKHRAVTQNASELISILDEEGNYLFVNESHERMLGHTPDELVGENALKLFHDEEREELNAEFNELMEKLEAGKMDVGEAHELGEYKVRDKEGNGRWVEPVMVPLSKLDGTQRFLVTARDVNERKEARQRVQYINQLYQSISNINRAIVRGKDFPAIMNETRNILLERDHYLEVELAKFGPKEGETDYVGISESDPWKLVERDIHAPPLHKEGPPKPCFTSGSLSRRDLSGLRICSLR